MKKYSWLNFLKDSINGKTLGRIYFNKSVSNSSEFISGKVLDIGAGINPSYKKYLPENSEYTFTDIKTGDGTVFLDGNKSFNFEDNIFDTVLLFNSIYIYEDVNFTLSEINRVLKSGGNLLLSSPFCMSEIAEPHDYVHYTKEGLEKILIKNNFEIIKTIRMGDRGSSAINLLHPFFVFGFVRIPFYLLGIFIDKISQKFVKNYPAPMGYFVICRKASK